MFDELKYQSHGPGPPGGPGPPPGYSGFTSPISHRTTETQRLENELQTCLAKIKGYETLGQLFQESKLECARYKQKNEELAKRLDSLTQHMPPCDALNESAGLHVQPVAFLHSNDDRALPGNSEPRSESAAAAAFPNHSIEQQACLNLNEVGNTVPPTTVRERSPGASSASSPSFVQINSSDVGSLVSPLSSIGNNNANQQPGQSDVVSSASGAWLGASDDLTSEVNRIAEKIKTVGHGSGASSQDLATDLIKAAVNLTKLQKQTRIQQILMDQMKSQISELKADIVTKQQTIHMLQKDCDTLSNTVKRMEIAREQAMQDARVKYSEAAEEQNDPFGGPSSSEWIAVESHQSENVEGGANTNETVVTAVPIVEVELRARIEKLNATISELVSVNRCWDEHCRQLDSAHEQKMTSLQLKCGAAERRLQEYEQADLKRQQEFDNILLNAKKQKEAEEMAKEEALVQLHAERQQRLDYEQKYNELGRKIAELESRLMRPYFAQVELTQNFQTSQQAVESSQKLTEMSSTREQELRTQLIILQEQVRVFKEDFDQERRDRELARSKMEELQKRLTDQTTEYKRLRLELNKTTSELIAAKTECDQWRLRYQKLSSDLQALQRQARPSDVGTFPRDVTHTPLQPQPPVFPNHVVRMPSWSCLVCTYRNDGQRTSCEICGRKRYLEFSQLNDASLVDGRTVAGLQQSALSAMPNTSLVMRSLETDTLPERR